MGHRLTKIYTRTGDAGMTGLASGERVAKHDLRIVCGGDIDEVNSCLGFLRTQSPLTPEIDQAVLRIQHQLFDLGAELTLPAYRAVQQAWVTDLEVAMDAFNQQLPPLKEFILPGGNAAAAAAHVARSVCRRAERSLVSLNHQLSADGAETLNPLLLMYINRLSDWLFVCARQLACLEGGAEVLWQRRNTD
jgi:cob(I)alamin adenosyltransferase